MLGANFLSYGCDLSYIKRKEETIHLLNIEYFAIFLVFLNQRWCSFWSEEVLTLFAELMSSVVLLHVYVRCYLWAFHFFVSSMSVTELETLYGQQVCQLIKCFRVLPALGGSMERFPVPKLKRFSINREGMERSSSERVRVRRATSRSLWSKSLSNLPALKESCDSRSHWFLLIQLPPVLDLVYTRVFDVVYNSTADSVLVLSHCCPLEADAFYCIPAS